MSKSFKIFVILSVIIFSIIGIYRFVATPKQIIGNNVGRYRSGDTAIFISTNLSAFIWNLEKGNIITFNRPDMEMEGVAEIEGVAGEILVDDIYNFSNVNLGNIVPEKYYAVRFGEKKFLRAVAKEDIEWVEWSSLFK